MSQPDLLLRPSPQESAPTPVSPTAPPRWVALDRVRAVSLLLMLFHHFTRWFSGADRSVLPSLGTMTITDVAAPAFAITAGASVVLFSRARRARHGTGGEVATVLRRYGLLIPIGVILVWVVSGDPLEFGVLQMLGLTTLAAYAGWRAAGVAGTAALALGGLLAGPVVEAAADSRLADDSFAHNLFGDIFPLVTYLGFVALGAAVAAWRIRPPRTRTVVASLLVLAMPVVTLLAIGARPSRYPGGAAFVLVSLVGTGLLYLVLQIWSPRPGHVADRVLRGAARHTFGVYVGHYGVFVALDRLDVPDVPVPAGMALAAVGAVAIALAAPHVPPLPFSPRGVRRRQPAAG